MPFLAPRLAAAAALAALAALAVPGSVALRLLVINGALLGAVAADVALATSPRRLGFQRHLPAVVSLDSRTELTWRIENPTARRLRVALADELAPSLAARTRRAEGAVPPRGHWTATTTFTPSRRGRFEIAELVLRVYGPLGLAGRQARRHEPSVLRVFPTFRSREEAELRIDRARILEVGLRSAQGRGGGTDFDQLREYTQDDEFRRIDWAATARSGRPIVRTYRAERNQNVVILLDNGRVMAGRVGGVPRVEYAMDAVLLVSTVATRLGDRCGLLAFDRRTRAVVPLGAGRHQVGVITEAIHELEPTLVESDYRGAFTETLVRFRRRSLIVLLTDLVEQAVGESLLPALPVIGRRHVLLVGATRDPQVEEWAEQVPGDEEAAYRKAAAVRTLEERRRTTARLEAVGATVVDTSPQLMAARLGDAYLDIKATGRL